MGPAQHRVQQVLPHVGALTISPVYSFHWATLQIFTGTSSSSKSTKEVSIVVAFRGTASVTLPSSLESCVNIDNTNIQFSLAWYLAFLSDFGTRFDHCGIAVLSFPWTEVKNMVTDVRISLQPLAEESKTGPFGICTGPVACFDLEPKAWLAAQCYAALVPIFMARCHMSHEGECVAALMLSCFCSLVMFIQLAARGTGLV